MDSRRAAGIMCRLGLAFGIALALWVGRARRVRAGGSAHRTDE